MFIIPHLNLKPPQRYQLTIYSQSLTVTMMGMSEGSFMLLWATFLVMLTEIYSCYEYRWSKIKYSGYLHWDIFILLPKQMDILSNFLVSLTVSCLKMNLYLLLVIYIHRNVIMQSNKLIMLLLRYLFVFTEYLSSFVIKYRLW